jgi:hypothetical protein
MKIFCFEEFVNHKNISFTSGILAEAQEAIGKNSTMKSSHENVLLYLSFEITKRGQDCLILEIGTFDGINSRLLVTANQSIYMVTMDVAPTDMRSVGTYCNTQLHNPKDWIKSHYLMRMRMINHPRIRYIEHTSSILNDSLFFNQLGRIDIFWIDGDHPYPQVAIDAGAAITGFYANQDQFIVFDDVNLDLDSCPSLQLGPPEKVSRSHSRQEALPR